jgi:hypothetical protein
MNNLMVWFQHRAELADGAVFFVEYTAKIDAASNSRVTMGECLVWGQISDPKIPLESSDQGLSIGVIKMQRFYCEIILY